ncbi:hypothetical protein AHAS_Ahas04G0116400 [Arachis hypogaea]
MALLSVEVLHETRMLHNLQILDYIDSLAIVILSSKVNRSGSRSHMPNELQIFEILLAFCIRVKSAIQHLIEEPLSIDHVERVLDNIYKVSEEHPTSRYVIRNAGIVVLIVTVLSKNSQTIGSRLRTKVLMTLLSIAKDEESRYLNDHCSDNLVF